MTGLPWAGQVGKTRPLGLLWAGWAILAAAAYARPVWTSTRLLFHPLQTAGGTVSDQLRAQATVRGSTLEISFAVAAVVLAGYSQLERKEIGIRATARTPLVVGRGLGAGLGSLFVLLWIPAGYALYRAVGSIWPLIVAHAVYDGISFGIDSWPSAGNVLVVVNLAGSLLGAVVMFIGYNRYWRSGQDGRRSRPAVAA